MKKQNKKKNKIIDFIVSNKKLLTTAIIILVIVIIGIFIFKYFKTDNNISIEIASSNANYIYGPNGTTILKIKKNDTVALKIITNKNKSKFVKCYAENNDIVEFIDKNTLKGINSGETELYCKLVDNISNKIKIKIGE